MSVTFTKEEIDSKIAEFEDKKAKIQVKIDFWANIKEMIPASEG